MVEWIRVDRAGCVDCHVTPSDDRTSTHVDDVTSHESLCHRVLIELSAQSRVIQVGVT